MADITRPRVTGIYGLIGGNVFTADVEVGAAPTEVWRVSLNVYTGQLVFGLKSQTGKTWKFLQPKRGILINLVEAVMRRMVVAETSHIWARQFPSDDACATSEAFRGTPRVIPRSVDRERQEERVGEHRREHEYHQYEEE